MACLNYGYPGGNGGNGEDWWRRPNGPYDKPMLELETDEFEAITVLVFGHSFIWRLERFAIERFGMYHNLELEYDVARIFFFGLGGMTVDEARYEQLGIVLYYRPVLVYIELGSNDLCDSYYKPETVGSELHNLVNDMLHLGVSEVIVGEVIYRNPRGIPKQINNYNDRVNQLNDYINVVINSEFTFIDFILYGYMLKV